MLTFPILAFAALAFAALAFAALGTAPVAAQAAGFCSEPVLPFCVNQPLAHDDEVASARCRSEVERYVAEMRDFAACLGDQQKAALERAGEIEDRLACMERGEKDCR